MQNRSASAARGLTLVLRGGNALGAYHLGVARQLFASGLKPDRVLGVSIGAVTAAILLGNPPGHGLRRLQEFWQQAATPAVPLAPGWTEALARRSLYAGIGALLVGRPGLFYGALRRLNPLSTLLGAADPALDDQRPLARTLERLVDFDLLAASETELRIAAVDVETGDEVWFDNRSVRLGPEHFLAATALPALYAPIEIEGRLLCDAGVANNLPIDRAFALEPERDLLCIAVDLFALEHDRPRGLDGMIARGQDLVFASQTRRAVAALARERALLGRQQAGVPAAVLALISFRAPSHQRALKTLDFSRTSLRERIDQGEADGAAMLARLQAVSWDEPFRVIC